MPFFLIDYRRSSAHAALGGAIIDGFFFYPMARAAGQAITDGPFF